MTSVWYIDFEAYQLDNKYYVKEISIVNKDTLQCYNYFVKNPSEIPDRPNNQTFWYQYKRHHLRWKFGDYNFLEAIGDIIIKVKGDAVFGKGPDKVNYLKIWLPQIEEMTWIVTPFRSLYNCISEVCEIEHGLNCARRKVHELRYVDCMYKK